MKISCVRHKDSGTARSKTEPFDIMALRDTSPRFSESDSDRLSLRDEDYDLRLYKEQLRDEGEAVHSEEDLGEPGDLGRESPLIGQQGEDDKDHRRMRAGSDSRDRYSSGSEAEKQYLRGVYGEYDVEQYRSPRGSRARNSLVSRRRPSSRRRASDSRGCERRFSDQRRGYTPDSRRKRRRISDSRSKDRDRDRDAQRQGRGRLPQRGDRSMRSDSRKGRMLLDDVGKGEPGSAKLRRTY